MKTIKKIFLIGFILSIFIIGFFLRSQETLSGNFLFLLDQGRDMMAVKSIIYDYHPTLLGPNTSLAGVFQGPLWYYLLAISTFLFHGNPLGNIVLMLIISMMVLVTTFFYMNKLLGYGTAIISLFFVAISPEAISAATYSWNPHPMWLLISFFIFFFYSLKRGNMKMNIVVWPIIALMFHFETALGVFMLLAAFIDLLIFSRKEIKNKYFLYGLLISVIFFLPQLLFEIRHNFLMTGSILKVFQGSTQGLAVEGEKNINPFYDHINLFAINFRSGFLYQGYMNFIPSLFFVFSLLSFFFGKIKKIYSDKELAFLSMLFEIIMIIFILTLLYPFPLRYWFLTGFELFFIYFVSITLGKLLFYKSSKIILITLFALYIPLITSNLYKLYSSSDYGGVAKVKGKSDAIKFIYSDAKGKPFNLLVFNPPVYTDAYDYLIFYLSKSGYGNIPEKNKKGIFYLLIEPDPSKPWSYKGWLETVIKTGNVLFTKELPSGLIIQKRENNDELES